MNRAADVAISSCALALSSPFLALAALGIKLEDGGPVLYRQRRVGKDGVEFDLLKLRTMMVGAEKMGAGFAVDEGDSRITRVGRLLRRLSLDELPQLWNVVRGDMSVIGPRPTLSYQVERYTAHQRRRLGVKPGLTGWAQVNGRATLPWDERIELDVWYVEEHSPWIDLKILARTPRALLSGTYKGTSGGWKEIGIADQSPAVPPSRGNRPGSPPSNRPCGGQSPPPADSQRSSDASSSPAEPNAPSTSVHLGRRATPSRARRDVTGERLQQPPRGAAAEGSRLRRTPPPSGLH